MKIMFLTPYNVAGGAERVLTSLANEFSTAGADIVFVTFSSKEGFYKLDNKVKTVKLALVTDNLKGLKKALKLPILEVERVKSICKVIDDERPNVVISFLFMTNIMACLCGRIKKVPVIISERNDPCSYGKIKRMVMAAVYKKASGMVCQSQCMKDYAQKEYGLNSIVVIPNPLSESQYSKYRSYVKKQNKIVTVGRLVPQKNQKLLIDAFYDIHELFPSYKLYIYGDGPLKSELQKQIDQYNLSDCVFLAGVKKDVLINNSDAQLFVLPSDFEGYPNVLVEAMANGIMSISTDFATKTAREIIVDGKNGLLVPTGDKEALVEAIKKVLSDTEGYALVAKEGINIIEKTSIKRVSSDWLQYINQIIGKEHD